LIQYCRDLLAGFIKEEISSEVMDYSGEFDDDTALDLRSSDLVVL